MITHVCLLVGRFLKIDDSNLLSQEERAVSAYCIDPFSLSYIIPAPPLPHPP